MLLALRLGRLDWRDMLDEMTPQEFDEWHALLVLEGLGPDDEWKRFGTVAAAAHNAGLRSAAAFGAKIRDNDIRDPSDYVPQVGLPDARPGRVMTAEESEARAKLLYG